MRPYKVVLAALAATLRLYRAGVASSEIPIWRQIAAPLDDLNRRASDVFTSLAGSAPLHREQEPFVSLSVDRTDSAIGGGSLPGQTLPSWAVVIGGVPAQRLLAALRAGAPAIIGRIVDDAVVLDLRTVEPSDDGRLADGIRAALAAIGPGGPTTPRRRPS
jgi:L-seryl-tRNA(Ser) seleniumtransferase